MPRRSTPEVAHTAYTDHRIRRIPQSEPRQQEGNARELRAWREPPQQYRDRNLGLAYVYAGQRQQAADWIQKGFAILFGIKDKDAEVMSALASVLMQKQLPGDAAAMFMQAARLQPQSLEHRHNAAVALLANGDRAGALHVLEQAIRVDPYYERSWLLMVQIHRQAGRVELARETVERYLRNVPQSLTFRAALAAMRIRDR
jgi:Tfp pilus assembly protein PilF